LFDHKPIAKLKLSLPALIGFLMFPFQPNDAF